MATPVTYAGTPVAALRPGHVIYWRQGFGGRSGPTTTSIVDGVARFDSWLDVHVRGSLHPVEFDPEETVLRYRVTFAKVSDAALAKAAAA